MVEKLTDALVKSLKAATARRVVFDREVPGFGVLIQPTGGKSFVFDYRIDGRQRRYTIGKVGSWSADGARTRARALRVDLDKGIDPFGPSGSGTVERTLEDLWRDYEQKALARLAPGSQKNARGYWRLHIKPALGDRPLANLRLEDIENLHRSIAARYTANRTVELLRRLFKLANRWNLMEHNPAVGIERNPETHRQVFLSASQVTSLMAALPVTSSGDLIRTLLFTGCRIGEARSMTWEQVDLDVGVWTKPAATVKQRREHRLPLPADAVEVLKRQARRGSTVFSREDGSPISDVRKTWSWALKRAELPSAVRLHDCRHTAASLLAAGGASLPLIGAVLGHTQAATTNRYAHLVDDAVRQAMEAAAKKVRPR